MTAAGARGAAMHRRGVYDRDRRGQAPGDVTPAPPPADNPIAAEDGSDLLCEDGTTLDLE